MKLRILLTTVLIVFTNSIFSQEIASDEIENGVRRIQSKYKTIDFENFFRYNLEKYICNGENQYFIRGRSEENEYHNFPNDCKLLFKTFDGEIIELTSVLSELVCLKDGVWEPTAYYPISLDQLNKIFTGISKIRVEMLSYNKEKKTPFLDYPEKEFTKDKMGKQFKTMFDNIEKKELTKPKTKKSESGNEKGTSLERGDASAGF
ncbi:MAG: hypothetical protein J6T43_04860 [Prevotella sp.]|nr:hypothetical protein [Prevotella sp.]